MHVPVSKGRLYCVREGRGPDVILIHGIPTNSYLWRNVTPLLRGFTTYCPDLLGYGQSDKSVEADLSLSAQASYIKEFMDAIGIREAYLIGHDIGGGAAQILSVKHPEMVKGLVIMDSAVFDYWPVPEISRLKDPIWDRIMENIDLASGIRRSLLKGLVRKERVTDSLVREYTKPFDGAEGKRAFLRAARALDFRDIMNISDELAKIRAPTLLAWGASDDYVPLDRGKKLAEVIKGSKLISLEKVGHFSPEDDPELVGMVVRGFLEITQRS